MTLLAQLGQALPERYYLGLDVGTGACCGGDQLADLRAGQGAGTPLLVLRA
jgi:hypothetical protein